jgi:molybdenum cofactor synthesis domain-containing protein
MFSVGILVLSDKGAAGDREDKSGQRLCELVQSLSGKGILYQVLPDEPDLISKQLISWCDQEEMNLILTTGGTGPAPRDRTPEATRSVIEREVPGIAELLRMEGYRKNPRAIFSRGISGIRGKTLIINLPGSLKAVEEGMELLLPILPHALEKILGDMRDCAPPPLPAGGTSI